MCPGNVFSIFGWFRIFENVVIFGQKTGIFAKNLILGFFGQYFESEKTFPLDMYLDGFWKFLVILSKNIFLPLFKSFGARKSIFGDFSKTQFLVKNLTISIDSLWNFLSKNVYFYLLYFISMAKTIFTKCEGGTILKWSPCAITTLQFKFLVSLRTIILLFCFLCIFMIFFYCKHHVSSGEW